MNPANEQPVDIEIVREAPTEAIVELYRAAGWWKENRSWDDAIPAMIKGSFCFAVAKTGDSIIGMARAISDGVSDAYIQDVTVLPEHRGRGIGQQLVRKVTQKCLEAGIEWVGLVAQPGTRSFYEGLGFGALVGYQPMLHGHSPNKSI